MKEKSLELVELFDFYGPMLTEKQQEFFDLYYNEDLSLGEIAENAGITRQGVRDAIQRGETILLETERQLHLVRRYGRMGEKVERILSCVQDLAVLNATRFFNDQAAADLREIRQVAGEILEEESRD